MLKFQNFWKDKGAESTYADYVIAVGDIMLSRKVGEKMLQKGAFYPFEKISTLELFRKSILFGNLEGPISKRGEPASFKQSNFRATPTAADALVKAGFNVLSLANNHIHDYGKEAVEDTLRLLRERNIHPIGVGKTLQEACKPAILEVESGVKIGFLAAASYNTSISRDTYIIAPIGSTLLMDEIRKLKRDVDFCVTSLHFGYENVEYPPPECRVQARKIIECGADLVIGHHPHVIQGLERYKNGIIAYSLGNFAFDNLTDKRRESLILRATFGKRGVASIGFLPVWINDEYQPQVASFQKSKIINRLIQLSGYLKNGKSDEKFWETAGEAFLSDQKIGFLRLTQKYGFKAIFVRLRHLRSFHLKLFLAALKDKVFG